MKDNLIVKDNVLVTASYRLTHLEQMILLYILSTVDSRKPLTDECMYTLDVNKLKEQSNIGSTDYYSKLKAATTKLRRREITLPIDGDELVVGIVQSVRYCKNKAAIQLRFNKDFIPYISSLTKCFTKYKLVEVSSFKSIYSFRIYELLIMHLGVTDYRVIAVSKLKKFLQLTKSYDRYNNLKTKVLEPAKRDISTHSSFIIDYRPIKTVNKVTSIEFIIVPKPKGYDS